MNRRPLPCVVRNLRPIPPTIELMPGVTPYDHEADPDDVPVLPDLVALAMSVLLLILGEWFRRRSAKRQGLDASSTRGFMQ